MMRARAGDANGVCASEVEHAVEDFDANGNLSGLRRVGMHPQDPAQRRGIEAGPDPHRLNVAPPERLR